MAVSASCMGRLMMALVILVVMGAAACVTEPIPGGLRNLKNLDCGEGGSESDSLEGSGRELRILNGILNNIVPRNDKGQPSFSFGPLTFGAEGAKMRTGSLWLSAFAALPLAVFALLG